VPFHQHAPGHRDDDRQVRLGARQRELAPLALDYRR
jgi:hypothetical protein